MVADSMVGEWFSWLCVAALVSLITNLVQLLRVLGRCVRRGFFRERQLRIRPAGPGIRRTQAFFFS